MKTWNKTNSAKKNKNTFLELNDFYFEIFDLSFILKSSHRDSRVQTYFERYPCHGISTARPGKLLCHDLVGEQTL